MDELLSALDRRAKLIAARGQERASPNLIVLPPSPIELARLVEKTAEFEKLTNRNANFGDLLRRAGYYNAALRGEGTEAVLNRVQLRSDAQEVTTRTLMLLHGCEFAKDFGLSNDVNDPRQLKRTIRWISKDEIGRLCPREDACESFYPSENPTRWRSCGDYWFYEEERLELSDHIPFGDETTDYFDYFMFDNGYWKDILPIALYSSGYFGVPVILQIEPTWKLYNLRTA